MLQKKIIYGKIYITIKDSKFKNYKIGIYLPFNIEKGTTEDINIDGSDFSGTDISILTSGYDSFSNSSRLGIAAGTNINISNSIIKSLLSPSGWVDVTLKNNKYHGDLIYSDGILECSSTNMFIDNTCIVTNGMADTKALTIIEDAKETLDISKNQTANLVDYFNEAAYPELLQLVADEYDVGTLLLKDHDWSIEDPEIAKIENDTIAPLKTGKTTIRAFNVRTFVDPSTDEVLFTLRTKYTFDLTVKDEEVESMANPDTADYGVAIYFMIIGTIITSLGLCGSRISR